VFLVLSVIVHQILCRIGQKLAPAAFLLIAIVAIGLWADPGGTTDKLLWCAQAVQQRCDVILAKVKNSAPNATKSSTASSSIPTPL
jgi:hypothetical protein